MVLFKLKLSPTVEELSLEQKYKMAVTAGQTLYSEMNIYISFFPETTCTNLIITRTIKEVRNDRCSSFSSELLVGVIYLDHLLL